MNDLKLYMLLLGCTPKQRHIEQHDIYFGIAKHLHNLVDDINLFWSDGGTIHIDGWREVRNVDGFSIKIEEGSSTGNDHNTEKLFFINLGGYKENEFEEFHYKMLTVATNKNDAIKNSKRTAFYLHTGIPDAPSHIDDKYGVDVDDTINISDILSDKYKNKYHLVVSASPHLPDDEMHLGYLPLEKVKRL